MGFEELRPIVGGFQVKRLTWGRLRRRKCLARYFEVFLALAAMSDVGKRL